jgi:hypothetical protein
MVFKLGLKVHGFENNVPKPKSKGLEIWKFGLKPTLEELAKKVMSKLK